MNTTAQEAVRTKAIMRVRTAADQYRGQHERLREAIIAAGELGILHREIAEAAGYTREWVQKIIAADRRDRTREVDESDG